MNVRTLLIVTRRPWAPKAQSRLPQHPQSQRSVRGGATDLPMKMALDASELKY